MARGRKPSAKPESSWRRGNGKGSVYKLSGNRRNPWVAAAPGVVSFNKDTMKSSCSQKILGYFPDKDSAEYALSQYLNGDYQNKSTYTFTDVYNMWSKEYFPTITASAERTIVSAYNYCTPLYFRRFCEITILDMENCINSAKIGASTKSRMKSMFNLMYDFAVKAEFVETNKARNFSLGKAIT